MVSFQYGAKIPELSINIFDIQNNSKIDTWNEIEITSWNITEFALWSHHFFVKSDTSQCNRNKTGANVLNEGMNEYDR